MWLRMTSAWWRTSSSCPLLTLLFLSSWLRTASSLQTRYLREIQRVTSLLGCTLSSTLNGISVLGQLSFLLRLACLSSLISSSCLKLWALVWWDAGTEKDLSTTKRLAKSSKTTMRSCTLGLSSFLKLDMLKFFSQFLWHSLMAQECHLFTSTTSSLLWSNTGLTNSLYSITTERPLGTLNR